MSCEFCGIAGTSGCIVCDRPAGVGIADPESIHYQPDQLGPRVLVRPAVEVPKREGCGCAWCRSEERRDPYDTAILLFLAVLLAFTLGMAGGIWWMVGR